MASRKRLRGGVVGSFLRSKYFKIKLCSFFINFRGGHLCDFTKVPKINVKLKYYLGVKLTLLVVRDSVGFIMVVKITLGHTKGEPPDFLVTFMRKTD